MIIIRATDGNSGWLFGKGLNDYASNLNAVAFDIGMNLRMFVNDCFFAKNAGIDWFNLMGSKNQVAIGLAINAAILNTTGVTGILQTNYNISSGRLLTVEYKVQTVYSMLQSQFVYDFGLVGQ